MRSFAPEVSVLALSIGLVLSLVCYLVTNLSPGGMISPGWLALLLVDDPARALIVASVIVVTFLAMNGLQRVVILYGKRLFATVVLVAVFLQVSACSSSTCSRRSSPRPHWGSSSRDWWRTSSFASRSAPRWSPWRP